jgi:DNA-binding transcriptional regulator YiaG
MTLGDAIRVARKEKALRQNQLAAILAVTTRRIQKWELDYLVPSPEQMEKLGNSLNLAQWLHTMKQNR